MNILLASSAGIALVNVALLVTLLTIYARIYKNSKAVFTAGLMFFAVVVHLAELAGIAALLKVTL